MNRYLEKIAEEKNKGLIAPVIGTAVGAQVLRKSTPNILGYHVLYHGTSGSAAKKILENGFDPSFGGTGSAKHDGAFTEQSAGKIHMTKSKYMSRYFSGVASDKNFDLDAARGKMGGKEAFRSFRNTILKGIKDGRVLKTRISHDMYGDFKPDPHINFGASKDMASTYNRHISSSHIVGGKGNRGILPFLDRKHLAKYWNNTETFARRKSGVAGAVVGTALTGVSGNALYERIKTRS